MEQLHYSDEVRSPSEVPLGTGEVKPTELALAKQLIEQSASDTFQPEKYHDTVRDRVLEAIQHKVDGQDITADVTPEAGGKILDLMDALKASLAREQPESGGTARKVVVRVLVGTSGYAFKEWKGPFYPDELADGNMLEYYATRYPTVEINNTFYRLPRESVLASWGSQVPDGFTFAIKASQRITHHARSEAGVGRTRRLPDPLDVAPRQQTRADTLSASAQSQERHSGDYETFLPLLPSGRRFTIEFRHPSWFDDEVVGLLRAHDVALCVSEQEDFHAPLLATASWGYLRLHRFDYDAPALTEWAARIATQPWQDAYVFFKHDHTAGSGPTAVDAFLQAQGVAISQATG